LLGQGAEVAHSPRAEGSGRLCAVLEGAVQHTRSRFAEQKLQPDQLAVTLADLTDPTQPTQAAYRGNVPIYPASVVKLFYLVAAHRWIEEGKLKDTDELRRAMRDMIVDSYNEATHYIVDLLTDTTSGPELPPAELAAWFDKRNAVNRFFASQGYPNINVNKKPWCEGPYGREMQAVRTLQPARNMLTTDATARLLREIVTDKAASPGRCAEMMHLLARNPDAPAADPDHQARFTGPALPPGARLWSKAGWTSETRHDAAYVELPGGPKFVLVTFTVGHANQRDIIPHLARQVISGLQGPAR
jgi:hypothetical protein